MKGKMFAKPTCCVPMSSTEHGSTPVVPTTALTSMWFWANTEKTRGLQVLVW